MLAVFCLFHLSSVSRRQALVRHRATHVTPLVECGPARTSAGSFESLYPFGVFGILYHLAFVFSVDLGFTNDSIGYYDMSAGIHQVSLSGGIVIERIRIPAVHRGGNSDIWRHRLGYTLCCSILLWQALVGGDLVPLGTVCRAGGRCGRSVCGNCGQR